MQKKDVVESKEQPKRWTRWILLPLVLVISLMMGLLALTACGLLPFGSLPAQQATQPPAPTATTAPPVIMPSLTPAWTATPQPSPTPTETLIPKPENTPTWTPEPTEEVKAEIRYQAQTGAPWYIPAFAHTSQGCQWIGLAGQIFDEQGNGIDQALVVVSGTLDGKPAEWMGMTSRESVYGPGGYEVSITDQIPAEQTTLSVQIFDLEGQALADPFLFLLPDTCERNMVLVNFQATGAKAE